MIFYLLSQTNREWERKEDERIRREQEIIRQREEEEMRREKGHGSKPQHHAPPPQTEVHPSPLFRAPSPIIEERKQNSIDDERPIANAKKNIFSPRQSSPPRLKGRQPKQPPPIPNPAQESPPSGHQKNRHHRSHEERPESFQIENHPIIEQLREETALAIQEATQARKGEN